MKTRNWTNSVVALQDHWSYKAPTTNHNIKNGAWKKSRTCERDESQYVCESCVRANLRSYYENQRYQFVMFRNVSSLFVLFPFYNKDHQFHYVSIVVPRQDVDTTVVPRPVTTPQWFPDRWRLPHEVKELGQQHFPRNSCYPLDFTAGFVLARVHSNLLHDVNFSSSIFPLMNFLSTVYFTPVVDIIES